MIVDGHSGYVQRHDAGWRLDPDDVDGFRSLIAGIIDNKEPSKVKNKSKNGRDLMRLEFELGRRVRPLARKD